MSLVAAYVYFEGWRLATSLASQKIFEALEDCLEVFLEASSSLAFFPMMVVIALDNLRAPGWKNFFFARGTAVCALSTSQ